MGISNLNILENNHIFCDLNDANKTDKAKNEGGWAVVKTVQNLPFNQLWNLDLNPKSVDIFG